MNSLNVGIIGLGRIADVHYPGYRDNKDARIYAVCDINMETAQKRKREWKAEKAYTDYREMLADPAVDAVEILTPHSLHEPMVLAAADAGKHIALQKPMTTSMESADRMLSAAGKSNRIFRVTDNYAFYPPTVLAKEILNSGDIGDPIALRIKLICGGSGGWATPPESWQWRLRENEEGRGTLGLETFDHGHHLWTIAWFLLGDVERVSAWIDSINGIVDAPSVMIWKYNNGCYGSAEYVLSPDLKIPSDYYANDEWIEITGTKGIIMVKRCTGTIITGPPVSVFTSNGWKHYDTIKSDWVEGFIGATNNFINSIQGKEKPMLSGKDAREVLRNCFTVQRSSRIRREAYTREVDSSFPRIYRWNCLRKERNQGRKSKGLLERLGIKGSTSRYAPQAKELTENFLKQYNPDAANDWTCKIGVQLLQDGNTPEMCFSLDIVKGKMSANWGTLPDNPGLFLIVPAGLWAAILMKKKRIEMAYLQGKLKVEGKAEEVLKLRSAFGL